MSVAEHKAKGKRSINCFVVTVSDTRDETTDESGRLIKSLLADEKHLLAGYRIVKDEPAEIEALLREALANQQVEAVVVNGGTGISPRDGTYEVIVGLLDKRLDGVLISLPGSKGAVRLALERLILPELGHMVSQLQGK